MFFSTDTSKYVANDGSNLISRKILCAELWRREDSMLEVVCALFGHMSTNRNQSQIFVNLEALVMIDAPVRINGPVKEEASVRIEASVQSYDGKALAQKKYEHK